MSFQLPYDLLNIAIETSFFQWLEVSHTLNHLMWLNTRQVQKEALLREDSLDSQILDLTEAEDHDVHKKNTSKKLMESTESSSSESSWTSCEMAEVHEQKSVKQWYVMVTTVTITVLFDMYYLMSALYIDTHPEFLARVKNYNQFGDNVQVTIFFSMTIVYMAMYGVLCISFIVLMLVIWRKVKIGYHELYRNSRCKMGTLIILLAQHLAWRFYLCFALYFDPTFSRRDIEFHSMICEISALAVISYVEFKNCLQNEEDMKEFGKQIVTNKEIYQNNNLLNSILNTRDTIEPPRMTEAEKNQIERQKLTIRTSHMILGHQNLCNKPEITRLFNISNQSLMFTKSNQTSQTFVHIPHVTPRSSSESDLKRLSIVSSHLTIMEKHAKILQIKEKSDEDNSENGTFNPLEDSLEFREEEQKQKESLKQSLIDA
jgi:hypothetical protein